MYGKVEMFDLGQLYCMNMVLNVNKAKIETKSLNHQYNTRGKHSCLDSEMRKFRGTAV